MGQKVNPHGLRVGVIADWDSKWYAEGDFADCLIEDYKIREFLKKKLYATGISKIEIERASERVKVIIYTAKPGLVIGKGGAEIEKVKGELSKYTDKKLIVDIKEVKKPDKDAQLVAENIAGQLENRISFRRAMKSCMSRSLKAGALGIKTAVSGRLGGADMARTEFYSEGNIPLQTLRADIDYGFAEADTTYGKVGVKVWIYKGEILPTRVKHRKQFRGSMRGKAMRGNRITNGSFGIVAMEPAWIKSNQIEAARIAMTRYVKRGGKIWIKIFPDKPVTAKPAETRMGSGKGSLEYWVAVVKPGRVLFEIDGVAEETAREALRLATHKLPCKCKVVSRAELEGGESNESK